jgi:hypothetical protein
LLRAAVVATVASKAERNRSPAYEDSRVCVQNTRGWIILMDANHSIPRGAQHESSTQGSESSRLFHRKLGKLVLEARSFGDTKS